MLSTNEKRRALSNSEDVPFVASTLADIMGQSRNTTELFPVYTKIAVMLSLPCP